MTENLLHPLCDEIDHWNSVIELRYRQFLEATTGLVIDQAERHIQIFSTLLETHIQFSDNQLLSLGDHRDESIQMIKADHLILRRTVALVRQSLSELEQINREAVTSARSALVDRLDQFVRLKNILKHHTERTRTSLFPLIVSKVDRDTGQQLADQLKQNLQEAKPI